ncbi:MAG TPA: DEAD/DEAH box helicase family protein, partial [Actinomycetota bacterium]
MSGRLRADMGQPLELGLGGTAEQRPAAESRPTDSGPTDSGLTDSGQTNSPRLVEVAVDAAGGRSNTFTYAVPEALSDLAAGEAVLVDFGRRQALGVVVRERAEATAVEPRSIVDRVRADGPLLPALGLALADWIASHYLAPPALVLRAMLPPGFLERLELIAELTPEADLLRDPGDAVVADLLGQLEDGPRAVRDLAGPDGRAGLLRRLRALAGDGAITLEWTLTGAGAGPRYERWIRILPEGRAAAEAIASGSKPGGRALGPRQREALAEIVASTAGELSGAELAGRHGTGAVAGLVRRGMVASEIRERPRRPLAQRPVGARGGRPPASDLTAAQADAVARISASIDARSARPLLLDGVTGAGKTAIYVEALARVLVTGRPALVLVPEI